jgi:hypothetical protein
MKWTCISLERDPQHFLGTATLQASIDHGWTAPFRAWPDPRDKAFGTTFQSHQNNTFGQAGRYLIVVQGPDFGLCMPPSGLRPGL